MEDIELLINIDEYVKLSRDEVEKYHEVLRRVLKQGRQCFNCRIGMFCFDHPMGVHQSMQSMRLDESTQEYLRKKSVELMLMPNKSMVVYQ